MFLKKIFELEVYLRSYFMLVISDFDSPLAESLVFTWLRGK